MTRLDIFLFGVPRFERGGKSIDISRRKAIALLAYLAATGQPHSRDKLATLFWPENDQSSARANLRRELSRLKSSLGSQYLNIDREQVGMNPEAESHLDVKAFQEKIGWTQDHDCDSQKICAECQDRLSEAVAIYSGDFMAGFSLPDSPAFDDWQFFQGESLRQSLAEALQTLITCHRHRGEYERGIQYARRWLALDPLHEPAHYQLMQLYAWADQQAAAMRQYQECVRLLEEELGLEPEEETTALYEAIRTRQLAPPQMIEPEAAAAHLALETPPKERYVQEERLAAGSHGEVYRCLDRVTGQPVVIKRLKPELVTLEPEFVARFKREGELLRQLNHPNIVAIFATLEDEQRHSIVMEYVPGGSLRDLLDAVTQPPLEQALDIGLELADALARAHHLGIIHRDIKPDNVLLAEDGTPRLTDFGLARLIREDARLTQASARLTEAGSLIGSPAYMSPEALRGEELDARSDIWSFGVLLYEMLAGRPPFDGEQLTAIMLNILQEPLPEIKQFRLNVPPPLENLLQRMLAKDRQDRIASMRQVAAELEAIRGGSGQIETLQPPSPLATERAPIQIGHNLPPQVTPLVGREEELAEITSLLHSESAVRLMTLTGPGGSGKTRLAIQAASILVKEPGEVFPDGVRFVTLAPLQDAASIEAAIANAVGFSFYADQDQRRQQLLDHLQSRRMLLVMDNFEHLLDQESVQLVADILSTAPGVKILATSRTRLNARGEHLFPVEGLKTPPAGTPLDMQTIDAQVAAYSAIQLFQQSAVRIRPDFEINAGNLPAVTRICQLVQGMPLGIELAATWLELLSPLEIATEIESSLDFLETEWYDIPERQRSLRAVFDSSWKLLTDQEREALASLTVFRGGFTRQAVQAVAGAPLKTLLALTHKSWLQRDPSDRFQIHELLRQYAAEKLQAEPGAWQRAIERHSSYYAAFLNKQTEAIRGPQQKQAFGLIAAEFENIRAAWRWLAEQNQVEAIVRQMLAALFQYSEARGKAFELLQLLDQALQALPAGGMVTDENQILATLLTAQAAFYTNGLPVRFEAFGLFLLADKDTLQQAWSLAPELEDLQSMGYWGALLSYLYGRIIDLGRGIQSLRQLLPYFQEQDRRWELAFSQYFLGSLLEVMLAGNPGNETLEKEAGHCLLEAQTIFQALGDERESGNALRSIGNLYMLQHKPRQAVRHWQAAQAKLQAAGERLIAADINWQMGDAYLRLGEHEQAFRCYRAMNQTYADAGHKTGLEIRLSKESYEAVRYGEIEDALKLRQQSLSLSRETGDVFGEAWSTWEMGEAQRVAGNVVEAREWFEQARSLFVRIQDQSGLIFYHRGMGDIAHSLGEDLDARHQFSESLRWAEQAQHEWGKAYALCGLGRAAVGLKEFESAHKVFSQALRASRTIGETALMLVALAGFANLYAASGEPELAAELGALVIHHRVSWRETKAQTAAALESAGAHLPGGGVAADSQRSEENLLEVVDQLLETGTVQATRK